MGSSEKTVKRATCFRRSCPSQLPCWRSAWLLQLPRSTTCRSCSSSATPPTTWRCSGEQTSRKPSPLELSRGSVTSMLPVMMLDKRPEMEDLVMMVVMTVVPTPPPPPPHTPHTPPPPPPTTTEAYVPPTVAPTYAPVTYKPVTYKPVVVYKPAPVSPAPAPAPAPYKPAVAYKPYVDEYADTPAVYTWEYAVKDDYTSNDFGAKENRDGYLTNGKYYVALPDGRLQTVTYTVDGYNGYVPVVEYAGEAQYPDAPAYKPAPSYSA